MSTREKVFNDSYLINNKFIIFNLNIYIVIVKIIKYNIKISLFLYLYVEFLT